MKHRFSPSGYTLIELALVVVILGILASVALRTMQGATDLARTERTRQVLDRIAYAIAGNPALVSGGGRIDFGYIGDVGSLPPNLDALAQNPGGYSTWHGPYLHDEYTSPSANVGFRIDAWGKAFNYAGGVTITSTGGGSPITRRVADSPAILLSNQVIAVITDLDKNLPGEVFSDSVQVLLTVPNGSGSTTIKLRHPDANGYVQFDSIPIGLHDLRVVYAPTHDTVYRKAAVIPGRQIYSEISLFRKVW